MSSRLRFAFLLREPDRRFLVIISATFGAHAGSDPKPLCLRWRKLLSRVRLVAVIALYIRPAGDDV